MLSTSSWRRFTPKYFTSSSKPQREREENKYIPLIPLARFKTKTKTATSTIKSRTTLRSHESYQNISHDPSHTPENSQPRKPVGNKRAKIKKILSELGEPPTAEYDRLRREEKERMREQRGEKRKGPKSGAVDYGVFNKGGMGAVGGGRL